MVNKIVLDYLRKYSSRYPLESLKRKILLSGYPEKEVNEAINILGLNKTIEIKQNLVEKPKSIGVIGTLAILWGFFGMVVSCLFIILVFKYTYKIPLQVKSLMDKLPVGTGFYMIFFGVFAFIFFLNLLAGIEFLQKRNWARVLLIILSIINILLFPVGTVLGVIFLLFLFRSNIKASMN